MSFVIGPFVAGEGANHFPNLRGLFCVTVSTCSIASLYCGIVAVVFDAPSHQ